MGWMFAIVCLGEFVRFLLNIPNANTQWSRFPVLWKLLYAPVFQFIVSAINGVAWWTIWKGNRSAKGWGIGASLTQVLFFVRPFIIPLRHVWARDIGALLAGIVGLVVFLRPDK